MPELLPGLVTLDDWGFPVIFAGTVPADLAGEAAAVVRLCPRLALHLQEAGPTGEQAQSMHSRPLPFGVK